MNEEIVLEIGSMFKSEIENFRKELQRIKDKHETKEVPYFYQVVEMYPTENIDEYKVVLKANKAMLAAFFVEQIT